MNNFKIYFYLTSVDVDSKIDIELTSTIYTYNGTIDSGYDFETGIRNIVATFKNKKDFDKCKRKIDINFASLRYTTKEN